jgi:hypothetical protein
MDTRNKKGQFVRGNKEGGRKPRELERRYLDAVKKAVSVKDLVEIFQRAVTDAKRGDSQARKFVADYTLGLPAQKLEHSGLDSMMFQIVLPDNFPGTQQT